MSTKIIWFLIKKIYEKVYPEKLEFDTKNINFLNNFHIFVLF